MYREAQNVVDEIQKAIDFFKNQPRGSNAHTLEGFDALKRYIGEVQQGARQNPVAYGVATDMYNSVLNTVKTAHPEYAMAMEAYQNASKELTDLRSAFGLGRKGVADESVLRRILSTKDNTTKKTLLDDLAAMEPELPYMLAGQELKEILPGGVKAYVANAGLAPLAFGVNPALVVGQAALASPRLAGKTQELFGKGAKAVEAVTSKPAGTAAYYAGRAQEEQARSPSTTSVVAQRVAAEPVPQFVEPKEIYNASSYAKPLEVGLLRREQTKRMADIMMRTGNVYKAMELRGVLDTMDNQLYKMQGDQGVAEFLQSGGRDANRMMGVYSYYTNQQYQLQPRRDGLFNLVANGQVVSQGMPAEKVVERIRLTLDEGFRQQQAAIAGKLFDSDIKIREENAKTMGNYIKDIGIKTIEGKTQLDVEKLKMMKYDVKPTGAGDGTVVITPPFGSPFVFNPSGTTVEIDGNKIPSFSARPITGMPSLSWANKG
jgi:hypothetical protein